MNQSTTYLTTVANHTDNRKDAMFNPSSYIRAVSLVINLPTLCLILLHIMLHI